MGGAAMSNFRSRPVFFSTDPTIRTSFLTNRFRSRRILRKRRKAAALADEPLIGYYTTRYVTAQSVAEAVHYVEEAMTTDEDLPSGRLFDVACTEVEFRDLDPEIREEAGNPDVPGVWYEEGLGFFSQIEMEQPHSH